MDLPDPGLRPGQLVDLQDLVPQGVGLAGQAYLDGLHASGQGGGVRLLDEDLPRRVRNTLEFRRRSRFLASRSAVRGYDTFLPGSPIGMSIARSVRSGHISSASEALASRAALANRPSSRETAAHPPRHPSSPTTSTLLSG